MTEPTPDKPTQDTSPTTEQPESAEQASSPDSEVKTKTKKRKGARKWILRSVTAVALLVVILVILAPTLISTGPGNALVFGVVKSATGFELENPKLKLGWLGGQSFKADRIATDNESVVIQQLDFAAKELSFFDLFSAKLGTVPIEIDRITVIPEKIPETVSELKGDGTKKKENKTSDAPIRLPKSMQANIALNIKAIEVVRPTHSVVLNDLTWTGVVESPAKMNLQFAGHFEQHTADDVKSAGSLSGDLQLLSLTDSEGLLQPSNFKLLGQAALVDIDLVMLDEALGTGDLLQTWIGANIKSASIITDESADHFSALLELDTPEISGAKFRLTSDEQSLVLRSETPAQLSLPAHRIESLVGSGIYQGEVTPSFDLLNDTAASLNISHITIPLIDDQLMIQDASMEIEMLLDPFEARWLRMDKEPLALGVEQPVVTITSKRLADRIDVSSQPMLIVNNGKGPVTFKTKIDDVMKHPRVDVRATLPINLADTFLETEKNIAKTIGARLTLSLTAEKTAEPSQQLLDIPGFQQAFDVSASVVSTTLKNYYTGQIVLADDIQATLYSQEPGKMELTPGVVRDWVAFMMDIEVTDDALPLELIGPAEIRSNLESLHVTFVSRDAGYRLDPSRTHVDYRAEVPGLFLRNPGTNERAQINDVAITLQSNNPSELVTLKAYALASMMDQGFSYSPDQEEAEDQGPGELFYILTVQDALDESGHFRLDQLHVEVEAKAQNAPSAAVDMLALANGQISALLGPQVELAELDATYEHGKDSPIVAYFKSQTTEATVKLLVTPDLDVIAADENDIVLAVLPTQEFLHDTLGDVLPILADAVAAKQPINLVINHEDLKIPLRDPANIISNAVVSGSLDLGRLEMQREGWLAQAILGVVNTVLKSAGLGQPSGDDAPLYVAYFTPVEFRLEDGIATSSEFWLVPGNEEADFGAGFENSRINLVTGEIEQMALGVVGASFSAGSGGLLSEFVKNEQIYTLPVTGTITKPSIKADWLVTELLGSITSRTLGKVTAGIGEKLFDTVGDTVRDAGTQGLDIDWDPPADIQTFIDRYQNEFRKKQIAKEKAKEEEKKRKEAGETEPAETSDEPSEGEPDETSSDASSSEADVLASIFDIPSLEEAETTDVILRTE